MRSIRCWIFCKAVPTLILASSSPRRRELLQKITRDFVVVNPVCEEISVGDPIYIAETNATLKGRAVQGEFVLACDTLVAMNGKIYGKPHTVENAVAMLRELVGKTHEVVSGVYVRYRGQERIFHDCSFVTFYPLTEEQIVRYVREYSPLDKAGSYGLQDGVVVESFRGSSDNVIGLPTEKIEEVLKELC